MSSYRDGDTGLSMLCRNIETAAVIGAGLSGIVSAVHLLQAGINVTVFERAGTPGGAWKFSSKPDSDPPYPNSRLHPPDWNELEKSPSGGLSVEDAKAAFAPAGPVYANMKSRGSEEVMRTSLMDWPVGTRAPIDHCDVVAHLEDIARVHHVEDKIRFRTRVEALSKRDRDGRWELRTASLVISSASYAIERSVLDFDAVVVATGRYNEPRVPDIPGLASWKRNFPDRISHSKQYRTPAPYRGKTVLIIGGYISALEVTSELVKNGAKVYESARDTRFDFRDLLNHENAEKVAMAVGFTTDDNYQDQSAPVLHKSRPIPGKVILKDGRALRDIHHVIIATGYLTSFPFLGPLLEQPSTALEGADEEVVTTADGRTVHNLHEDIFYIPDPTLAFIGVTHFASTFSLYDFQAEVLAAVFARRVRLPSKTLMKAEQRRRKERVLPGTLLNSIFLLDDFVIRRLMDWVNGDLEDGGFEPLTGPDPRWWRAFRKEREGARSLLGLAQDNYLDMYGADWDSCARLCPGHGRLGQS